MRMDFRIIVMRKRNYNQLKLGDCEMFKIFSRKKNSQSMLFDQKNKPMLSAQEVTT